MSRLVRLAAVIAPVLGLAGLWALSNHTYRQGTEWAVPIAGYDPRDILRGHYVEFTYNWPGINAFRDVRPAMLCLEGTAPVIERVTVPIEAAEQATCAHPIRASGAGVYSWDELVVGRLYIGQERAAALQEKLRNPEQVGIVTIRQRNDGSFTAIAIRFRALTPAEKAAREARHPPPIVPPPAMEQ